MDSKEVEELLRSIEATPRVKLTLTQINAIGDEAEFADQIVRYVCGSPVEALRPPPNASSTW